MSSGHLTSSLGPAHLATDGVYVGIAGVPFRHHHGRLAPADRAVDHLAYPERQDAVDHRCGLHHAPHTQLADLARGQRVSSMCTGTRQHQAR